MRWPESCEYRGDRNLHPVRLHRVPEPAGIVLIFVGGLLLFSPRRRAAHSFECPINPSRVRCAENRPFYGFLGRPENPTILAFGLRRGERAEAPLKLVNEYLVADNREGDGASLAMNESVANFDRRFVLWRSRRATGDAPFDTKQLVNLRLRRPIPFKVQVCERKR